MTTHPDYVSVPRKPTGPLLDGVEHNGFPKALA